MTIDELYRWINWVSNKEQAGSVSPNEFNLSLKIINIDLFKEKYGLPEEYRPGQPIPTQSWQITQKITDDLSFLLPMVILSKVDGYFQRPSDYLAFSSIRALYTYNENCGVRKDEGTGIEIITDSELSERLNNSIIPPSKNYPIGNYYEKGIKVWPELVDKVILTYLREPKTPFRAYNVVNDIDEYDEQNSTQLEWPVTLHNDFAVRMLQYYGVNLAERNLYQFSESRKMTGK